MRIVHLSDIHLSIENISSFEQYYIDAVIKDLIELDSIKKIEAICITGDLIDKGGSSLNKDQDKYKFFLDNFWSPISKKIGIGDDMLFIVPGNHDINETYIKQMDEKGIKETLISIQDINNYVEDYTNSQHYGLERQKEFKDFERSFYENRINSNITNFESHHTFESTVGKIGIVCINSSWRCSTKLKDNELVFGTIQISRAAKSLKDKGCKLVIGLMHHPLDIISDIEKEEAVSMFNNSGYDAVLFGHTHDGKSRYTIGNHGNLFISVARTGFSNPLEIVDKYRSGYTILDFDINNLSIECSYRKYIHARNEFDKDVDLAKDGRRSFPLKSVSSDGGKVVNDIIVSDEVSPSIANPEEKTHDENNIVHSAYEVYIQAASKLNYNSSKEDFEFAKSLEKKLYESISVPFNDKIKNIPALRGQFVQSLFDRIYSSESFDDIIIQDIQKLRDDKNIYNWYERKVVINAISLSLIHFKKFSQKKADLLIDFLTDFEENVWESALVGLVISLLHHHNKWERFSNLKNRLGTLKDLDRVQQGLHDIEQILRLELYKESIFDKSVYDMPFFENPLNCFMPFYEGNPVLESALDNNTSDIDTAEFEDEMMMMPFLDSYKYMLCLIVKDGNVVKKKLIGDEFSAYNSKLRVALYFHPFQNILCEYFNYFNYYSLSKIDNIFNKSLSINDNKLKDIILEKTNELNIIAESYMDSHNYRVAMKYLNDLLKIQPDHYHANWKMAICLLSLEKPDAHKALKHLMLLNEKQPNSLNILLQISDCYEELKNKKETISYIEKAKNIDSHNRKVIIYESAFYINDKNWNKAVEILQNGLNIYPNEISLLINASIVYNELGDYDSAITYGLRAELISPTDRKDSVYSGLSRNYLFKFDFENSLKYAKLLLDLDPSSAFNLMNLGRVHLFRSVNDLSKARMYLDKALRKEKMSIIYGNIGHLELVSKNRDKAFDNYKEAIITFGNVEDFADRMDLDIPLITSIGVSLKDYTSIKEEIINYFKETKKIDAVDHAE